MVTRTERPSLDNSMALSLDSLNYKQRDEIRSLLPKALI